MTLSLQLYSMRDCADQIALLGQLSSMGIKNVEGYGGVYGDAKAYRAAMDANGISMPSGHMGLADIETDFEATMQLVDTLGMKRVFAPYLDEKERPTTSEGYIDLAKRLNAIAAQYAARGVTFGWHNHDFEFVALSDGNVPMDLLLEHAPDIAWEADIAWIVRGGCDPLDYIAKYGARISAVHVKDIAQEGANTDQDGWSDLGAGVLDWASYLSACRALSSSLIYALEHDKPKDPVGYAANSVQAFNALWEQTND